MGSYDNMNIRMKSNFSFWLNLRDFDLLFWIGDGINPFALHFFRRCCWRHRFRFFFERQEHLFLLFHQCLPFEARIRVNRDVGFRLVLFLSIFRSHVSDFTVNWPLSPSTVKFSKCPTNPTKKSYSSYKTTEFLVDETSSTVSTVLVKKNLNS